MFLLPFALTILGFSTSSGLRERFSLGASTAGASSFFALAAFFGGLAAGSAPTLTGPGAPASNSPGTDIGDSETGDKTSASGICAAAFALEALALGLSPLDGLALFFLSSESAIGEIVERAKPCQPSRPCCG